MSSIIREATASDTPALADLAMTAFGAEEGPEIAALIEALLADPTARPLLSLVATAGDDIIGHVLFTAVSLRPASPGVTARILAPLAVRPGHQGQGIGGRLVRDGLERLRRAGTDLVFVLGDPRYYSRFGFTPAGRAGFEAPHPIPPEHAGAWMVLGLAPDAVDRARGRVTCADSLADRRYWIE